MKTIILFLFSLIAAQTAFGQVTHRDDKKILNAERSLKVEIELNSHEESADNNTPERQIKIYDVVEQQPSFPGGNGALMKWLESLSSIRLKHWMHVFREELSFHSSLSQTAP